LNEVLIIRPHYAEAYLNRGLARFELEDYASALRDYDQCIKLDPKQDMAFNNRGIVKQKLEDYAGAIMDYDMAIKLNQEMASAYFNRGMAKELLRRPGFEKDYQIAAQLDPRFDLDARKLDAQKLAQNQKNQQKQGNTQVPNQNPTTQNSNTNPNNSQNTTTTASNQTNNSTPPSAEEEEKAAKKRRQQMNLVVEDNRDLPKEEEQIADDGMVQNNNIVIDLQPIFLISAFEKNAVDYDRSQYYNLAIDDLNQKNNYNPILSITNKTLTQYKNVFENFVLYFNERLQIEQNSHNLLNRGIFYSLTGKYNESVEDLTKAISLDEKASIAYFTRANSHYKIAEKVEQLSGMSNQMLVSLKNRKSGNESAQEQLMMDYSEILKDYETTLFLNPKFFFGYYNRAFIKLRIGEYKSALEDLNRAIELEPEFAEAYFNRGLTKIFLEDEEGGAIDLSHAGELGILGAYNIIKRYCN
jgi:tetratricopeptide (TPR) repeat protein